MVENRFIIMIGRRIEFEKLQSAMDKNRGQLIAIYGRRRVGKTFLVNEFFKNQFAFKHTAISPVDDVTKKKKNNLMKLQLQEFYFSMRSFGLEGTVPVPASWQEAFFLLQNLLEKTDDGKTKVVFVDELPWMDTPKSNFLSAFEYFCNHWCLARNNFKLVVCGSATSWILDKLINNRHGLYGRVTMPIHLAPFTLYECQEYFSAEGFKFDKYDICRAYFTFGGIPYYLDQFRRDLSLAQNIDAILFDENAPLKEEFDRLFTSQFSNPEHLKQIVIKLAEKRVGYTREELANSVGLLPGGTLTNYLSALEKSKLIIGYKPFGERTLKYKLVDPFCNFYLKHVRGKSVSSSYWQANENTPAIISWMGYAFEDLCINHIRQIKQALGISGVITTEFSWNIPSGKGKSGVQIDLAIDREDRFLSLCEMKFTRGMFEVSKKYSMSLLERMGYIQEIVGKKKAIMSVLVTTFGLKRNEYASRFDKIVTIEDLFQN